VVHEDLFPFAWASVKGKLNAGKTTDTIISMAIRTWICLFIDEPPHASYGNKCTLPLYCLKKSGEKSNLTFESSSKNVFMVWRKA
jgi:hypothetical protein